MNEVSNEEAKDKKLYELALLLKSENDLAGAITLLRQHDGELVSEPRAKKLALAYVIKGNTEAVFASCTFRASGTDAKELERDLSTRPEVIRSMMLVSPPPAERQPMASPSFPMQKRGRPSMVRVSPSEGQSRPAVSRPLSNEALEKKIEEISQ